MLIRLNLRGKLLAGYTVPMILLLGIAGIVYSNGKQVAKTFIEVERVQALLIESNKMSLATEGMIRSARGYMIDKNESFLKEYQQNIDAAKTAAKSAEPLIKIPAQKKSLDEMVQQINLYEDFHNQIIQLLENGKQAEALQAFKSGKGTSFVRKFEQLNRDFNKIEQQVLNQETNKTKADMNLLILVTLGGFLLIIIFKISFVLLLSATVTQTINQVINSIASSSTEIATTVEEQERIASQQAASVHETTSTMDELGASSRVTAEQAESAAVATQQTLQLAETGIHAVDQTLEKMEMLKNKVTAIAEQIERLTIHTSQIGNINSLVRDLANQTNMLALNAAVEAVRAGEHGKGFGVVALEIRKLADQSKKSAEKISNLIDDIQVSINATVKVTGEGKTTVDEGLQITQKTAAVFTDVSDAINSIVVSTQQISFTAKEQAIAVQQVIDAMNNINQGAVESATGITQTKIGTQKLNEAALSLKAIV